MPPSLLLWDIDGTLVDTARAGERALLRLLRESYQRDYGTQLPVALAGRTDLSIFADLFRALQVEAGPNQTAKFQKMYLALLEETLPTGKARLHAGIQSALEAVHAHAEVHQGLLTGNLREGARLKLSHLGIWKYFEFGAFADDSAHRNELGPFALRRAREKLGLDFPPERIFIIGDTEHDIACGKAIGAKTIAVATGAFTVEDLRAFQPTYLLPDLSNTDAFLKLVLED